MSRWPPTLGRSPENGTPGCVSAGQGCHAQRRDTHRDRVRDTHRDRAGGRLAAGPSVPHGPAGPSRSRRGQMLGHGTDAAVPQPNGRGTAARGRLRLSLSAADRALSLARPREAAVPASRGGAPQVGSRPRGLRPAPSRHVLRALGRAVACRVPSSAGAAAPGPSGIRPHPGSECDVLGRGRQGAAERRLHPCVQESSPRGPESPGQAKRPPVVRRLVPRALPLSRGQRGWGHQSPPLRA